MKRKLLFHLYIYGAAILCSAIIALAQSSACKSGYVPREAVADDLVCVTPAQHKQALADNSAASSRLRSPGSDLCVPGYVWRGAVKGDHVCVTHEVRDRTKEENEQAASHASGSGAEADILQKGREAQQGGAQIPQKSQEVQLLRGFHRVTAEELAQMRKKLPPAPADRMEREFYSPVSVASSATMISTASAAGMAVKSFMPAPPAQIQGYELAVNYFVAPNNNPYQLTFVGHVPMQQLHMEVAQQGAVDILLTLNANPGQIYMLDCNLGEAGTVQARVSYFSSNVTPHQFYEWFFYNNGNLGSLTSVVGTVSTTSGHTLIPIAAGPATTASIGVFLSDLSGIGIWPGETNQSWLAINGCTLDVVNPQ
jgi:hypothetical protein